MNTPTTTQGGRSGGLYPFIWRWHFYAGLFTAPFLVILAATGALYLFKTEIEGLVYRPLMIVPAHETALPPSRQEAAVLAAYPGAQVRRYALPPAAERAAEWTIRTAPGERITVFVDPGSGRITGALASDWRLMDIVSRLHGELLAGRAGDYLVEFAGCWAFVLLVTGIFLWWPRKGRTAGVALPQFSARGRRLWRDLHAVSMAWNALIIAFLILSGLPWSGFWGETLASLGTIKPVSSVLGPTPNFRAFPSAPAHSQHEGHQADEEEARADGLPWSVRQAPEPAASGAPPSVGIDWVMGEAQARGIAQAGLRVFYPSAPGDVFTLSFVPDKAQNQRTVHFDPADGAIIEDIAWEAYTPLGKAVEFGVMTHMGRQFGPANQWVLLASCLLIIASVGFGIAAWWARRPEGKLGVPPIPDGFRPGPLVVSLALVLGVIFPLVGLSMILILMGEWLFARLRPRRVS